MKAFWDWIKKNWTAQTVRNWMGAFGGTRFILSLGAGVATTTLAWFLKITPEIYRDVVIGTVGMYIAGSTVQQVKEAASSTTVQVAEITGEAPVVIDGSSAPIKVELSAKGGGL